MLADHQEIYQGLSTTPSLNLFFFFFQMYPSKQRFKSDMAVTKGWVGLLV